ncbi:DUF2129 domain-containing protein [Floricoccus tropicus]|uniref:DUF2129 domain-containing protein n=1 Tax=Floricoccus tropicus TaxID=1859473 RepID=UPI001301180E|nr:DUF2129 domain-containing protein [Floricoccus tropicus]
MENSLEIQKRRALYIYYNSYKHTRQLRKFGEPVYTSRKLRYVKIYVNEEEVEEVKEKLEALHFVKEVQLSYIPDLEMDFSGNSSVRV